MPGSPMASLTRLLLALAAGLLFLLPHLVRIHSLGSYAAYTPFSALSPSPMVWDETFLYGAQVNYTLTHRSPANDTDTWEHRNQPYPYSILPIQGEALLARAAGSAKTAHLLCAFLFPALSALLLITLFTRLGASPSLAGLFALAVLVLGFSPTTLLLNDRALLHHMHGPVLDSLQASRTPNPNLTFPLFLAAILCLTNALRRPSDSENPTLPVRKNIPLWPLDAGILGGLLFLSYIYFALAWSAAVLLLALISLRPRSVIPRTAWITLATTILVAIPFLWWKHLSTAAGAYLPRSLRMGLETGHTLHPKTLLLTAVYLALSALAFAVWRWLDTRPQSPRTPARAYAAALIPVLLAVLLGALAGLNMQLLTGFNIQPEHHYPHMVLQPLLLILAGALFVLATSGRTPRILSATVLTLFFAACAAAQVADGLASAEDHRLPENDSTLFAFLNQHTPPGSVVATDNLRLSVELPTFTHNRILFANGTRSTAPDSELIERFLLASRLAGASPQTVRNELSQQTPGPRPAPQIPTYSYYLFEASPFLSPGSRRIAESRLPDLLAQYQSLDPPHQLAHYRVDFLWVEAPNLPPTIPGWSVTPALATPAGHLFSLAPAR